MNNGEIRSFVRTLMDADSEDMPDVLLDASIREAVDRIAGRDQRWPFYESRWTLTTTEGVRDYPLTAAQGNDARPPRDITMLWLDTEKLCRTDEDTALRRYGRTSTGKPQEWSQWGNQVTLWPTPAEAVVIEVRGYRAINAWSSADGAVPDVPEDFHPLICDWVLANEYQRQDDTEMSQAYRNKFEDQLAARRKAAMALPTAGPIVLGGGHAGSPRIMPWASGWQ